MVNPVTLYRYLERNPEVYEELQLIRTSEREKLLDASEHVIAKTLAGEDERLALDAAKFTLDRTGKARGWVTKKVTEHQGAGGGEIKVKVEYEDKRQLDDAIDVEHRDLDEEDGSTDDQPE